MILLLGDIHGNAGILRQAIEVSKESDTVAIVQLGDFGLFRDNEEWFLQNIKDSHIPIYFIDGNHDDCSRWIQYEEVTRIWDDLELFYVPRGTVMELNGRTVAFMGGAGSIDKKMRLENNMHWDINENISSTQVERLYKNALGKKVDMFLTHCPPHSVIEKNFDPTNKLWFGVGIDWRDPNQDIIEDAWDKLNYPPIYSGHMHKRIVGNDYRILNINELLAV
jgi:Icc-related predicted phosphoesterase